MSAPVSQDELHLLRDLYDRGLYVQAHRQAEALGPMKLWTGTAARLLAGRIAGNVGAPRLARVLHYRAWKDDRQDPEAVYYHVRDAVVRRGLLAAWEMQEQIGSLPDAPRDIQADFCALRGYTLGRLRDFVAAEHWLARAEALAPQRAWIFVERSAVMELEDRLGEALSAALQALKLRPWYRPAVQCAARVYGLIGRDSDALELLTEASTCIESFAIFTQLAALQRELGQFKAADESLTRAVDLAPMIEKDMAEWLTCLRADAAYLAGDMERARELSAAATQSEMFQKFAQRLAEPGVQRQRVHLPVGFVRQHHQTCAPATLTAITRYWGRPAEHLEVAAEICYDGTPQYRLRDWAERNGWVVREFTVTWDDVVALIDRGVPFALTVSRPGQAHLQAIIGYDRLRETWLVRDPGEPYLMEAGAEGLLEYHRFSGPPGLALVPKAEAARLEGLTLTDQELYDRVHQLCMALNVHDRPLAQQHYETLIQQAPEHRLTRLARISLARYDGDITTHLRCVEQLLMMFPDEPQLLLFKLHGLRELGRRTERLALLEELLAKPECDPLFRQEYARELSADARQHVQAEEILRGTLRIRPDLASCMAVLGNVYWQQRQFERALMLYRFAMCTDDKEEDFAQAFFSASRYLRKEQETVAFLRSRFERFGKLSGRPARTLFWAYDMLERTREGFQVLDAAISLRPQDGDLLLFAAGMYGAYGRFKEVRRLLDAAQPYCRQTTWLRTSAHLARAQGALKDALAMWQQVLETEPLASDAHAAVARLLEATAGRAAATSHLEEAAARFPHHYPIHQLWIEWLRDEDPIRAEAAVRHIIEINPADVWAHRELALVLGHQQRHAEALAEAEAAIQLGPNNPHSHGIYGHLSLKAGHRDQAREALRQAIRLSADVEPAIYDLVRMSLTEQESREALAFVHAQLLEQVIFGDGLLAYRNMAEGTLQPEELLGTLKAAHEARPDLWQAWLALTRQLLAMEQHTEALHVARAAVRRFPLVARCWYERARVFEQLGNAGRRIVCLQKVLKLNTDAAGVARELADVHRARNDLTRARTLIEQALARDPTDAASHVFLAEMLWAQGDPAAALARLEQALRLDPGFDPAWEKLTTWGPQAQQPDAGLKLARLLTEERAGDPQVWVALARVLEGPETMPERLAALDKAIALRPSLAHAHDLRATLLAEVKRFDEALAACRPAAFGAEPPMELRGRAAWIEARRGHVPAAVEAMQAVLADRPDYQWGWIQLLEWLYELKRHDEVLTVAEQLLRLDPDYGPAYGYRGDVQLARKERAAAKQSFEKALAISPDYSFAAGRLFDLYIEDQAFDDAERVLQAIKACDPSPEPLGMEVWLNLKRERRAEALAGLKTLCVTPGDDDGWLNWVVNHAVSAGWSGAIRGVLEACLHERHARVEVGEAWARHFIMQQPRKQREKLLADLRKQGEIGYAATAAYLERLAELKRHWDFRAYVRKQRAELRANVRTWYSVGEGLGQLTKTAAAVRWFADWRQRPALTSHQLLWVALTLRRLDRNPEAACVSQYALDSEAKGPTWFHELWLALDEALAGAYASARERIARAASQGFDDGFYDFIRHTTEAILVMAGQRGNAAAFAAARANFKSAAQCFPTFRRTPTLVLAYRRCARRVAREHRGVGAWLWALWKNVSA